MVEANTLVNVVVAGLGGQGVLKASDILAEAAFRAGRDVKKSEIHGMSQRGGSVTSDVRFGARVLSPMVPAREADFLVVLDMGQAEANRASLRDGGILLTPDVFFDEEAGIEDIDDLAADDSSPITQRNLNVAMLGVLSGHLDIPEDNWTQAIQANLPAKVHAMNLEVFSLGRKTVLA